MSAAATTIWLLLLAGLGFIFFHLLRNLFSMIFNIPLVRRRVFNLQAMERITGHLPDFVYYQKLSPAGKNKFLERLVTFMINKDFIGEEGLQVTEEMRVRVSAAAVQITFGLEHYLLPKIERIHLYPDQFSHERLRRKAIGLVTWHNDLRLSWKHFQAGYADPSDRVNLGLHEMAHALKLQIMVREGIDETLHAEMRRWLSAGQKLYLRMKKHHSTILRAKAGDTLDEFFAISTEHFFEAPADLKQHLPEYYKYLCRIYRQDPLNAEYDYAYVEGAQRAPEAKTFERIGNLSVRGWHWSHTAILLAVFPDSILLTWLCMHTAIAAKHLLLLILALALANLISWPYFRTRAILGKTLFAIYSLVAVGAGGATLLLALNFLIPVETAKSELHKIEYVTGSDIRTFHLENGAYEKMAPLRSFWNESLPKNAIHSDHLEFEMQRGLLGMKTLKKVVFH